METQPPPIPSRRRIVQLIVIEDMRKRMEHGIKEYGMPLQPHNGRDALQDAYEEALDLCMYLKQAILERE